jgi:hypothetical protein
VLDNAFTIVEDRLPAVPVTEDARLSWIPYFETVTTARSNTSIIVTILLPITDQREAENIVKTSRVIRLNPDELEVSVSASSGNYRWVFEQGKDGFVLKN